MRAVMDWAETKTPATSRLLGPSHWRYAKRYRREYQSTLLGFGAYYEYETAAAINPADRDRLRAEVRSRVARTAGIDGGRFVLPLIRMDVMRVVGLLGLFSAVAGPSWLRFGSPGVLAVLGLQAIAVAGWLASVGLLPVVDRMTAGRWRGLTVPGHGALMILLPITALIVRHNSAWGARLAYGAIAATLPALVTFCYYLFHVVRREERADRHPRLAAISTARAARPVAGASTSASVTKAFTALVNRLRSEPGDDLVRAGRGWRSALRYATVSSLLGAVLLASLALPAAAHGSPRVPPISITSSLSAAAVAVALWLVAVVAAWFFVRLVGYAGRSLVIYPAAGLLLTYGAGWLPDSPDGWLLGLGVGIRIAVGVLVALAVVMAVAGAVEALLWQHKRTRSADSEAVTTLLWQLHLLAGASDPASSFAVRRKLSDSLEWLAVVVETGLRQADGADPATRGWLKSEAERRAHEIRWLKRDVLVPGQGPPATVSPPLRMFPERVPGLDWRNRLCASLGRYLVGVVDGNWGNVAEGRHTGDDAPLASPRRRLVRALVTVLALAVVLALPTLRQATTDPGKLLDLLPLVIGLSALPSGLLDPAVLRRMQEQTGQVAGLRSSLKKLVNAPE